MTDRPVSRPITSTYRLQFHKDFPFCEGEKLVGYLASLGVSHVYVSPILRAREGSLHGYDVVDYDLISPELGGETAFRAMAAALSSHDIGLILDIVPNHVAVGGSDNAMWLDLLKRGQASRYADWFDIDFQCQDHFTRGKVHAPFLGEPLRQAIAENKLEIVTDLPRDGFALRYGEHLFPIRSEDDAVIQARGLAAAQDPVPLRALIDRQHYRLDSWRNASDRLNWRRFFEVTQLAGVRMEKPEAFEAAHRIAFALYADGLIDGLRVDHIDGLADPAAYCANLRRRLNELRGDRPPAWLLVEKILAPEETLPATWGVDGTTGYDFMDQVSALQHDLRADEQLSHQWALVSGRSPTYRDEEDLARREVLEKGFSGQRELLASALLALADTTGDGEDLTLGAIRRAIAALLAHMRAYRTYATGKKAPEDYGPFFGEALRQALLEPLADTPALDFIVGVIRGTIAADDPARIEIVRRLNQLSSPLAARAVEDTTFYRYGRLLSRNDVGFDARLLGSSPSQFHDLMRARATNMAQSMLALATHDHKRGADVRSRLAVVSEIPKEWIAATKTWFGINAEIRPNGLDAGDEYVFYQLLVGSWPLDPDGLTAGCEYADRMVAWWIKALREAKLRSSWAGPNQSYEAKAEAFARAILDPQQSRAFHASLQHFVDRIAPAGAVNGLIQLIIQCTVPGIPDTYQGAELWDLSGVDPDNRRPVDFDVRKQLIIDEDWETLLLRWRNGAIKQQLLKVLLHLRRRKPNLFRSGSYIPLQVTGTRADAVLAYARTDGDSSVAIVVPVRSIEGTSPGSVEFNRAWWADTAVILPAGSRWTSSFSNVNTVGSLPLRDAFSPMPFWIGCVNSG